MDNLPTGMSFEDLRQWSLRRRPPPTTELEVATLTCHVAFFKPIAVGKTQSERVDALNNLLQSIQEKYADITFKQALGQPTELVAQGLGFKQGLRQATELVIPILWHTIPVTLRVMLHSELISYVIYIQLDRAPPSEGKAVVVDILY